MDWKQIDTTNCGIKVCSELLGDKWVLLILRDIHLGVTKFQDLQNHLGASSTIVANRLKKLTEFGLLNKVEYRVQGARAHYEYQLTEKGQAASVLLIAMSQFGYDFLVAPESRLTKVINKETGESLRLALVDSSGQAVNPEIVQVDLA